MNALWGNVLLAMTAVAVTGVSIVAVVFRREIRCIQDRDPAATSALEIILTYAGLHALVAHRLAQLLWSWHIPFFPRWLSQVSRWFTGIEIHPGARIGRCLFIDHGMGVVIGETAVIGNNVTLYQGVTLGGTGKERGKRHPNINDNVVIGAGAKILGNITIGENSYIGANAVVIQNTPPHSTVVGVPGHVTKQDGKKIDLSFDHAHVRDPLWQRIDELQRQLDELAQRAPHNKKP